MGIILITKTQYELITVFLKNKDKKNRNYIIARELGITVNALRTRYHSLINKGLMTGGTGNELTLLDIPYDITPLNGSQASRKIKLAKKRIAN